MLSVIKIEESKKWNKIVKTFKDYDIYYLLEYCKTFQINGDGEPLLFYYKDESIRAMNVVMKRDIGEHEKFKGHIPTDIYFDFTTPYGYGGFLIEGERNQKSLDNLRNSYEEYCNQNNIVSEFARFHPILNNAKYLEYIYDISDLGKTVSIDLRSPEYIWNNLVSKNRNVIRKAIKNNVEIFWGRSNYLINKFIKMYNDTMDKDNADEYYYFDNEFYESILNNLKYNFLIFYAVYEEKIISMSIILFANKQIHYHLSASIKEYLTYAPTNLLLYEAACWGSINGYETMHLGGGLGSKEDGLYKFKKSFNKAIDNDFSVGRKIFSIEKYNELMKISNNMIIDKSYFPEYRG